ncbi:MAG: ATP-dependent DNA helicase RecG [Solirubrobacterales bacterium]
MAAGQPVAPPPFAGGEPPGSAALLEAPVRWPLNEALERPLSDLPGIGPKLEQAAREAGVSTVLDLLWRVPGTYGESPDRSLISQLEPGQRSSIAVQVLSARRIRVRRRGLSVVEAVVGDDSGQIKAVWFNRHWVLDQLQPGRDLILQGRLEKKGFVVAEHQVGDGAVDGPPGLERETPRARHSSGGELGPARWRRWSWQACQLAGDMADPLPSMLLRQRSLPGAAAAIREAHFPSSEDGPEAARRRLAYEELFLHQVVLAELREGGRTGGQPSTPLEAAPVFSEPWLAGLPFRLTGQQEEAIATIAIDLARPQPMRRLLMGEVGSGKTIVALWAMLRAVESGRQAALMAPTEVLVEQHASTIAGLLRGSGVKLGVLTGSSTAVQRRQILTSLGDGEPSIVVGTQALLEEPVRFGALSVCVVDEEHRFGVRQRSHLESKAPAGESAHLLHLSATPIPRTLSLTSYGDLDITSIRELPSGRLPVTTEVIVESDRARVFERVRLEVDSGRQAFVICPLVEESDSIEARAAEVEAERLGREDLAGYEVGLVHGRMPADRKETAMRAFEAGKTDVLVATTVIEVGIDVPNATVIVIEGAERFGLAQLHQLRGRVGRGKHGGCCLLMTSSGSPAARRRLAAVASESDGFRLAEIDLETRGEGEVTGTRQHGLPRFRVARLPGDVELLEAARADLDRLVAESDDLRWPGFGPMSEVARSRFDRTGAIR